LKLVDFIVCAPPFCVSGEALDALDEHTAIPRSVKHHDLAVLRQSLPEALEVMQRFLALAGSGDAVHLETARIERPAEPANHAALAGGVPSLEDDDSAIRRSQIGLLYALQRFLQVAEPTFVVCEVDLWEAHDSGKVWAFGDDEVGSLHAQWRSIGRVT